MSANIGFFGNFWSKNTQDYLVKNLLSWGFPSHFFRITGNPPPPQKKKKKYSPSNFACQIEQFLFFLPDNLKNTLDYLSKSHKSSLYYIYNFSKI